MKRDLLFPLVLGAMAYGLPLCCYGEGVASLIPLASPGQSVAAPSIYLASCDTLWKWYFCVGAGVGVIAMLWRLGRRPVRPSQFVANLGWCLSYAFALIEVNVLLVYLFDVFYKSPTFASVLWREDVLTFGWFESWLFNGVAIACATIYSATSDDVLIPDTVMRKLRRSATTIS